MNHRTGNNRARSVAGLISIFLPGLGVAASELMKFAGVPAMVSPMAAAGFGGGKLILVASLGLTSALLFLYPRTRSIGVLLLSSFLGGAICLHVQRGEYTTALAPSFLLSLAWVGTYLRHPGILWSFGGDDRAAVSYSGTSGGSVAPGSIGRADSPERAL